MTLAGSQPDMKLMRKRQSLGSRTGPNQRGQYAPFYKKLGLGKSGEKVGESRYRFHRTASNPRRLTGGAPMQELIEYIVRALVDQPEGVTVTAVKGERTVIYEVKVAPEDVGKVIGKEGRIAHALRTVVKAAGMKHGQKVTVEIIT